LGHKKINTKTATERIANAFETRKMNKITEE